MDFDRYVRIVFSVPTFISVNMHFAIFQVVYDLLILGHCSSKFLFCICFCSIIHLIF